MIRTSPLRKFILIILGLILGITLLEAGLRLGGFILTSMREWINWRALQKKDPYIIMCLGESTTAGGDYPRQLERILNEKVLGMKFSVLNKGYAGTSSAAIVAGLEAKLDKYRPDMAVAMMGINDGLDTIADENTRYVKVASFFRNFRVYKLVRLLREHIFYTFHEMKDSWRQARRARERASWLEGQKGDLAEYLSKGDWHFKRDR